MAEAFAQQTIADIENLVDQIHKKFGEECLIYKYKTVSKEERFALWSVCNVYLNTSLKEGLCLQPQEFVYVKKIQGKLSNSACIVSEFTGNARKVAGLININSYEIEDIVTKMNYAVNMSKGERSMRMNDTFHHIVNQSTLKWAFTFLNQMKSSKDNSDKYQYKKLGMGQNWQFVKTNKNFRLLDVKQVERNYASSKRRLIIIDEDMVIPLVKDNDTTVASSDAIHTLSELARDPVNTVIIVSTETKEKMENCYKGCDPDLSMAAENGYFWRWNSLSEWNHLFKTEHDFFWIA